MLEMFTAMPKPCKIGCPFQRWLRSSQPCRIGCPGDGCKADSHAGKDATGMIEKLTAIEYKYPRNCLKSSQQHIDEAQPHQM